MNAINATNALYSQDYKVCFYNVDCKYDLKPETILGWAGEIAGDHLRSRNITREQMWADGQVFLLTRCYLKYKRTPKYQENIRMSTWEYGTTGVKFNRLYSITDENGEVLADAFSTWILVNPLSHKILRPKEYAFPLLPLDKAVSANMEKINFEIGTHVGDYRFVYSDIDANGHVNNTVYARLSQDFSPFDLTKYSIESLDISFIKEGRIGDVLSLFTHQVDDRTYQAYGEFSDGKRSFEAQITVF